MQKGQWNKNAEQKEWNKKSVDPWILGCGDHMSKCIKVSGTIMWNKNSGTKISRTKIVGGPLDIGWLGTTGVSAKRSVAEMWWGSQV